MTKPEEAAACFESGFSCSQAVFSTFATELGMDRDLALGAAGAFGAGMAGRAETCGAVSGALMVLGMKHAKRDPKDDPAREKTYALADEFIRRFEHRHGSIMCRSLVGYDLRIPEEYAAAQEIGAFAGTCPNLVREAAQILEELEQEQADSR
jgi:C_GCAxxG_C_C family probable redox protein